MNKETGRRRGKRRKTARWRDGRKRRGEWKSGEGEGGKKERIEMDKEETNLIFQTPCGNLG